MQGADTGTPADPMHRKLTIHVGKSNVALGLCPGKVCRQTLPDRKGYRRNCAVLSSELWCLSDTRKRKSGKERKS